MIDFDKLNVTISALLSTAGAFDKRRLIEQNLDLLTGEAIERLERLAEDEPDPTNRQRIIAGTLLLRRCREIGIAQAFSESEAYKLEENPVTELQTILDELRQPTDATDWARVLKLSERGIALARRESSPEVWGTLQISLGETLYQDRTEPRGPRLERSIEAYKAALEVTEREGNPASWAYIHGRLASAHFLLAGSNEPNRAWHEEEGILNSTMALEVMSPDVNSTAWAITQMNLAIAYHGKAVENPIDNLELAIQSYESALKAMPREELPTEWIQATNALATLYLSRSTGDRDENKKRAIQQYELALDEQTRRLSPDLWASMQMDLALVYLDWTSASPAQFLERRILHLEATPAQFLERGILHLEAALEELTPSEEPDKWASAQVNLGTAYSRRTEGGRTDNLDRAILAYRSAMQVFARGSRSSDWALTLMNLSSVYQHRRTGDREKNLEQAIMGFEQVLGVITREKWPKQWSTIQASLAASYFDRKRGDRSENLERTILAYEAALQVLTRDSDPTEWSRVQTNLALAYSGRNRGDQSENLERTISHYEAALPLMSLALDPFHFGVAQLNLANAYLNRFQGDRTENLELALQAYESALKAFTPDAHPEEWATTQMCMGIAYRRRTRGDHEENLEDAIQAFEAALTIRKRNTAPDKWATAELNLANVYLVRTRGEREENLDRAITGYEAVLEVHTPEAHPFDWAKAQMNLGAAYGERHRGSREDNLERAIQHLESALRVRTKEALPVEWAKTQVNIANVFSHRSRGERANNVERAITAYSAALEEMKLHGPLREFLAISVNLGNLYFDEERWAEAVRTFEITAMAHNLLYHAAATSEAREVTLQDFYFVPSRMAYSLAKTGEPSLLQRAVEVLEAGRTRVLTGMLRIDEASMAGITLADKLHFETARERVRQLESEAREPEHSQQGREFLTLMKDLRCAREELEESISRIREYAPQFLAEPGFEMIQAVALSCPIVYLTQTNVGGLALIVERQCNVRAVWLPDFSGSAVMLRIRGYFEGLDSTGWNFRRWLSEFDAAMMWLWDAAVWPVLLALAPHTEAVFIPGGLVGLLPLHAAFTNSPDTVTGRRYATDELTFYYSPSARVLGSARTSAANAVPNSIFVVDEPRPVGGAPLPYSAREADAAAHHFQVKSVLRNDKATRDAVLKSLPDYSVVHFSCHGSPDFVDPLEGGLVLAGNTTLTLRDFLNTRLPRARLAVLSACSTGVTGVRLPDEALGLPTGLLFAGVDAVIASLWSVSDASTMILMTRFYDSWKNEGETPAEALQSAQRWVRDTTNFEKLLYFKGRVPQSSEATANGNSDSFLDALGKRNPDSRDFAHPFNWAAFTYSGA